MGIPRKAYEDQVARSEAEHRAARGETYRDLARTCGHMVFWVLVGWVCIGFAVHTTSVAFGKVLWWTGIALWIPGVLFSLLAAYRRGEKRGDW
jgi:hypothetical protein